jgi:hypothetical protein
MDFMKAAISPYSSLHFMMMNAIACGYNEEE